MGFCALGLGFMKKNNRKMGMEFRFEQHRLGLWDLSWDLKKNNFLGNGIRTPPSRPSLKVVAFVCLKAHFDTPVHPFALLLCLSFCSSCSAVINNRLLGFPFLNLTQCLCGNPPLVVGVPGTQHFIACPCDYSYHSLPTYVNGFLFHQLLQGVTTHRLQGSL